MKIDDQAKPNIQQLHYDRVHQGNKGNEEFLIAACEQSGRL
jgi:hypothetical protein